MTFLILKNSVLHKSDNHFLFCQCNINCGIDGHNTAPATDANTGNTRIYGEAGQPAKQLSFTYEPDGAVNKRANQIREKLYPKK